MWSFKLDAITLQRLDVLRQFLGLRARGNVLDLAVTALWRERIRIAGRAVWCSVATDGTREDEILRRLHDLAVHEGKTMTDVVCDAVERLYRTLPIASAPSHESLPTPISAAA